VWSNDAVIELRTAHTAWLTSPELHAVRQLLDDAFDGDFGGDDFEHTLGGVHALIWEGPELVAHGAVVMRRLYHGERVLRAGYVEGVAVRADRRRRGHGDAVMAALEEVIRGAYEIGALSASEDGLPFYAARGWRRWTGTASVLSPGGRKRTEDDEDTLFLLPVAADLADLRDGRGDLACDWRAGDVW